MTDCLLCSCSCPHQVRIWCSQLSAETKFQHPCWINPIKASLPDTFLFVWNTVQIPIPRISLQVIYFKLRQCSLSWTIFCCSQEFKVGSQTILITSQIQTKQIISMTIIFAKHRFFKIVHTYKHLMACPKLNREFCFLETVDASQGKGEEKQNSLFPRGPVILMTSQLKKKKKMQRNCLLDAGLFTGLHLYHILKEHDLKHIKAHKAYHDICWSYFQPSS